MIADTLTPETRRIADELRKYFLVPFQTDEDLEPIRKLIPDLPAPFILPAETFCDRIKATVQTTASPFLIANTAAYDQNFLRMVIAERIMVDSIDAHPGESEVALQARKESIAHQIAKNKMEAFCSSREGIDILTSDIANRLLALHTSSDVRSVARELLLQGTVSVWSALEMLFATK